MAGQPVISHDVLASYAASAALEIDGVQELVSTPWRRRGIRVSENGETVTVEVHVAIVWGASAPDVGAVVQERVGDYLARTAKIPSLLVDVVVDDVAQSAAG